MAAGRGEPRGARGGRAQGQADPHARRGSVARHHHDWSSYKLLADAREGSVSPVLGIGRKGNGRARRLVRHMVSKGPDFETKAADVIGLYLNPPVHAVVFCVDEKTAIQALDRQDRMLPLSPG